MSTKVLGYEVCTDSVEDVVRCVLEPGQTSIVNTINPHSYVIAKDDEEFRNALRSSNVLLPDGVGIVIASKILSGTVISKTSGMEFFLATMTLLNESEGKVLFFGSTETVLKKIKTKLAVDFPKVVVELYSPPFKSHFNDMEIIEFSLVITKMKADVVFFGLTAPKQEKLIARIGKISGVKLMSGIGAVFDFYAGTVKRPSEFWIRMNLEWLVRLVGEPQRLWRRNLVSAPIFILDCIMALVARDRTER